jgi:hypothetical protein
MSVIIKGGGSANLAEVNTSNQLKVVTETSIDDNPSNVGAVKIVSENDSGTKTGEPYLLSPETDDDFRIRIAQEILLDNETFNYTAQNTGKHTYSTSTITATWTTAGLTTNGGSVTTTGSGLTFGTYAEFPLLGASHLYAEFEAGFSNQPVSNAIIDFGMFRRGGSTAYAPTDGAYFRLTSAGLQGVTNYNGSETTTSIFAFSYNNNQKYQFIISINERDIEFWIDNVLYGKISTPVGQGQPFMSATLPLSIRHAHTGTTSAIIQLVISDYTVSVGGTNIAKGLGEILNASLGSYQGLSGGTMGSLTAYTNSTNPTAAVPSNTALTANLPSGLGGQAWETFTTGLAANADGILMSYQVPAGTVSVQGRRLKITSVKMTAYVQTALTGGGFNSTFALAFGHTAVSLATAEAATAKARRIVLLPELTQTVASGAAALTLVSQVNSFSAFDQPIYVNPGEFVAFTVKHIGTVASAGVIAYNIQYVYSWE